MECAYCGKEFSEPGYILEYQGKLFCDEDCLGKWLYEKVDDDVKALWFDTPENIEICAKEQAEE